MSLWKDFRVKQRESEFRRVPVVSARLSGRREPRSRWLAACGAALLILAHRAAAGSADREPLLEGQIRQGWEVRGTRGLAVSLAADGVLQVQPSDRTRPFATAILAATPGAHVAVHGSDYLTFEINTLPGAGGLHRAPSLRVGLSDASGRSRQPLLSRYLLLDADPITWQPVLIPVAHLLDRGANAGAITSVTWQYAGPAAPFAVRRVALLASAGPEGVPSTGPGNLIPDPSFEQRRDARPIWCGVGDYRDLARAGERTLEQGPAAHGRRFLRLRGTRAYFFEAMAPQGNSVGFAVALSAPVNPSSSEPMAEIGCEVVGFGQDGGIALGARATRTVILSRAWRRHAISAPVNPSDLPPHAGPLFLYRAWVRPLRSDIPVDVDAAYLAASPVAASAFVEDRANALMAGTGVYRQVRALMGFRPSLGEVEEVTPPRLQVDLPPLKVPLVAREWAGRIWEKGVVAGGIPLARGRLYSPDALRLRNAAGKEIPFQYEVLRQDRQDGSVRCLWIVFQDSVGANQNASYSLESGGATTLSEPPLAYDAGDEILLNTGKFRMRLARRHFPLFTEADLGGTVVTSEDGGIRLELLNGRLLTSLGTPSRVAIERNGPIEAVLLVEGFLTPQDSRPAPRLRYQARLRAWKEVPGLQVEVAVTNLTSEAATPVRSLALVVPLGSARRADATIGCDEPGPLVASLSDGEWIRLTQMRDPFREGREDLVIDAFGKPPIVRPGRAAGWARWQSPGRSPVLLAFRHMADRHPCALEVGHDKMVAYLLPPVGAKAFDFPFGLTLAGTFWLGVDEPPAEILDRLQRPILLSATPPHLVTSGVFPPLALPQESARDFPFLDAILTRTLALWVDDRERLGEMGWLNDGDTGSTGLWRHGEPDALESLYLQYLRSGDPLAWERARRQTLHLREVGTWWSNENSAFLHPKGGAHIQYRLDLEHFCGTGLLYDYWLTGDRRSLDVAQALGSELLWHTPSPHYGSTERGRLLLHLAECYEATGYPAFRTAFENHLKYTKEKDIQAAAGGLILRALHEGADWPDGAARSPRLGQVAEALGKSLLARRPFSRLVMPQETILYPAFAFIPPERIPRASWEALLEHMLWLCLGPAQCDPALVRATTVLRSLKALGVALPKWAAGWPLGIAPFSGRESRLTVRIHRRHLESVALTLCRMRAEPLDLSRCYRVHLLLRDPTGKRIDHRILQGDAFQAYTFSLPSAGLSGDYELTLACEEDGLAELVSAHPHVYLRADEWKSSRYAQGQGRFFLKGPRSGEVRLALRGSVSRDGDGTLGATLRALDGKVLARARWSAPSAGTSEDGSPPQCDFPVTPLRLEVPPEVQGRPLAFEITSPKGIAWRVEGLEDPWLAATPAAFE